MLADAPPDPSGPIAASRMDSPSSRLQELRGEVAKRWLVRLVESATLEELQRLPTARIARELPELVSDLAAAASEEELGAAVPHLDWARRLAELTGREGQLDAQHIRDVASLQSVMITALHRQLRSLDARATLTVVERLTEIFSAMQAEVVEDVLRHRARELEWLGTTDALTGLHNERYLRQHVQHLLAVQQRYGHPFALVLVDVDGLGRINDAYGSAAGDRTLVDVATALGEGLRAADTPIRMGEDEFCVLLPNQTASRARSVADRMAAAIEGVDGPGGHGLAVAIGVVACPEHAASGDELLELAEAAMYRARAAGHRVEVGRDEPAGDAE